MTNRATREKEAAADLIHSLASIIEGADYKTEVCRTGTGTEHVDVVMTTSQGPRWSFEIKSLSRADPARVLKMVTQIRQASATATLVLVADEIPEVSRQLLRREGWGYLDRRGHLSLVDFPTILIDTEVEPMTRNTSRPREPIRGASGISFAAALLMTPDAPPSIREVARRSGLAVSTIADAAGSIRDAALIDRSGQPLIPDLFWALSDAWRPERTWLKDKPMPGQAATISALRVLGDRTELGWAVTGDLAAVAFDAPMAVASGHPPDFYVPDRAIATNAARTYGVAADNMSAACTISVAPTPLACVPRFEVRGRLSALVEYLLTHPLFVALDLAADKSRGVEILAEWSPEGFARVW